MSKNLLRKYIKEILVEIANNKQPAWAKWFHLSSKDLGDTFEFTTRLPWGPYEDDEGYVIEDHISKRTSWAPSVEKAVEALQHSYGTMYIYSVKNLPGEIDLQNEIPKCNKKVGTKNSPYDSQYSFRYYFDKLGIDKRDLSNDEITAHYKKFSKKIKNCVPDAEDTDEHWATKSVVAKRVGTYNPYKNTVKWD